MKQIKVYLTRVCETFQSMFIAIYSASFSSAPGRIASFIKILLMIVTSVTTSNFGYNRDESLLWNSVVSSTPTVGAKG